MLKYKKGDILINCTGDCFGSYKGQDPFFRKGFVLEIVGVNEASENFDNYTFKALNSKNYTFKFGNEAEEFTIEENFRKLTDLEVILYT